MKSRLSALPMLTMCAAAAACCTPASAEVSAEFHIVVTDKRAIGLTAGGAVIPVGENLLSQPILFAETLSFASTQATRYESTYNNVNGSWISRQVTLPIAYFGASPFTSDLLASNPFGATTATSTLTSTNQYAFAGALAGNSYDQVFASSSAVTGSGQNFWSYLHSYRSFANYPASSAQWYSFDQSLSFLAQNASSWYETAYVSLTDPVTGERTVSGFQYLGSYVLASAVPEPTSSILLMAGLTVLLRVVRMRQRIKIPAGEA